MQLQPSHHDGRLHFPVGACPVHVRVRRASSVNAGFNFREDRGPFHIFLSALPFAPKLQAEICEAPVELKLHRIMFS